MRWDEVETTLIFESCLWEEVCGLFCATLVPLSDHAGEVKFILLVRNVGISFIGFTWMLSNNRHGGVMIDGGGGFWEFRHRHGMVWQILMTVCIGRHTHGGYVDYWPPFSYFGWLTRSPDSLTLDHILSKIMLLRIGAARFLNFSIPSERTTYAALDFYSSDLRHRWPAIGDLQQVGVDDGDSR